MRYLLDENQSPALGELLRRQGHEVRHMATLGQGTPDEAVLQLAVSVESFLVTADKDFADLVFRDGLPHSGVLLVRLNGLPPPDRIQRTLDVLAKIGEGRGFYVVTKDRLRSQPA